MFTQLDPTIPVHVADRGEGYAFAVIDYGQEHNLIWVTALNDSGEIWCAPNPQVRVLANWTMGRSKGKRQAVPAPPSGCDAVDSASTQTQTSTGPKLIADQF